MSDFPQPGWVQGPDGKWRDPAALPPIPAERQPAPEASPKSSVPGWWKRRGPAITFVVVAVVIGIVLLTRSDNAAPARSVTRHITYKVDGTATSADLTYNMPSGTTQQQGVDVPLRKKADHSEGIEFNASAGQFLYISAQNQGDGTVTCHILVNGAEVAANTARGSYAIATCQA